MAKEKTDAASLFDAMNKNRGKLTGKVNNKKTIFSDDDGANIGSTDEKMRNLARKKNVETTSPEDILTSKVDLNNDTINDQKGLKQAGNSSDYISTSTPADSHETRVVTEKQQKEVRVPDDNNASYQEDSKKDKELQHIHIALPMDVYEKLEIGKKAYYNNKTTYIRNLILDDYERNKDYYMSLPNIR